MALRNDSGYGGNDVGIYVDTIKRSSEDDKDDDESLMKMEAMEEECEDIGKVICISVLFSMAVGGVITIAYMAYLFYAWFYGIRLPHLDGS